MLTTWLLGKSWHHKTLKRNLHRLCKLLAVRRENCSGGKEGINKIVLDLLKPYKFRLMN